MAEVTVGDKFIPLLVDASAQLLQPRMCACTFVICWCLFQGLCLDLLCETFLYMECS